MKVEKYNKLIERLNIILDADGSIPSVSPAARFVSGELISWHILSYLYKKTNMTVKNIAKLYNVNRRTIHRHLKKMNIKCRGKGNYMKNNGAWNKGIPCSEKLREINRKNMIKLLGNGKICKNDTKIERIIENYLLFNNILYIKQFKYKLGVADFWLPEYNIIIECDGDYWHNPKIFPKAVERDKKQTKWLENNDFTVIRFSESEINKNMDYCTTKIGEMCE